MSKVGLASGFGCDASCAPTADPPNAIVAVSSQPMAAPRIRLSARMCRLPGADFSPAFVEDPLVIALAHLEARLRREQAEDRRPHVEHGVVRPRTLGSDRVGAEQE